MHRVLVIGTVWPYHSGGARVPGLAKYLSESGWEPIVLTRSLPAGVNLPYRVETVGGERVGEGLARGLGLGGEEGPRRRLARRLHISSENPVLTWGFRTMREVLEYPDGVGAWRRAALQRTLELVRGEHFDAVISTSPPVSSHLIAAQLKRQYGLTWVADFPHLWSQDHGVPYGRTRRWFDRRLEVRTLAGADALTTTNPGHAALFAQLHGEGRVRIIPHGFDPDTTNDPPSPLASRFTLTYTGGFSRGVREPEMLLRALAGLVSEGVLSGRTAQVSFYGQPQDWVQEQIDVMGLAELVRQHGQVPQAEAFERQRESHLLLNFKCEPGTGEGILSSKVYEYLAARRPVLSIGAGDDVADDVLGETSAGLVVEDVDALTVALRDSYREYLDSGTVAWRGDVAVADTYSQLEMARQFARLLRSSTSNPECCS
ncbi:MAG: hypothetical protein M0R22_01750 [Dehalococcoidia bacterium]|nr:hypothetical protein [Dehalococcoidia bacterium]